MGYIADNLSPGEAVRATVHVHWGIFLNAIWSVAVFLALAWFILGGPLTGLGVAWGAPFPAWAFVGFIGILAISTVIHAVIYRLTTEMAVTTKKVVAKWGLIGRRTMEQRLSKIESIVVDQGILGRLFNYGSVFVHGTGSSSTPIRFVADPTAFRRAVEAAIEASEGKPDA